MGRQSCVMAEVFDCGPEVNEFKLQALYYVHFWTNAHGKGMNPFILPALDYIVPLLFFYKGSFGFE